MPARPDGRQDKYKLEVQVVVDPRADSTRKDLRTLLFESVREFLFNAVKHAQTDRITSELILRDLIDYRSILRGRSNHSTSQYRSNLRPTA